MKKTFVTLFLTAIIGNAMAQDVTTYSVYDTNQSGDLNVADVTTIVDNVKKNVSAQSTQQYVTGEDLKVLLNSINQKLEKLDALENRLSTIETKCGITSFDNKTRVFDVAGISFKMMPVGHGSFIMGTDSSRDEYHQNEKPGHLVTITKDFYIGETEVTEELWNAIMGSDSSEPEHPKYPKVNVSWDECQQFIVKLNAITGLHFRFPTEAEWEYAARGGNKSKGYEFSGGNEAAEVCWYGVSMGIDNGWGPHDVGTKMPNELNIYDMCGNVAEMCSDWYADYENAELTDPTGPSEGQDHVVRGGGWFSNTDDIRITSRSKTDPDSPRGDANGFRLALSLQ